MTKLALEHKNRDLKIQVSNAKNEIQYLKETITEIEKKNAKEIDQLNNKIDQLFLEIAKANAEIVVLREENAVLKKENAELKEENTKLRNEVDRLKKQFNTDSNNSSKPPSSDIKPNIPNNREKTKRTVGGQKGHKASYFSKEEVERKIKNKEYKHEIIEIGEKSEQYISKYIIDISVCVVAKEMRFYADEHGKIVIPKEFQSDVQYGPEIKTVCAVLNTEGIVAINRLTDFVRSISHGKLEISNGTICNFLNQFRENSRGIIEQIKTNLMNTTLLHTDGTSVRCDTKNVTVRNYSTETYTLLMSTEGKSKKYIKEMGVLPHYTGKLVHDHETVLYNYGEGHGECNVHIARYLKGNYENTENTWSCDMRHFLCSLNEHKKKVQSEGRNKIEESKLLVYSKRYDEILSKGIVQNEKTKSKYYKTEEKRLLNRLTKYKENHLLFVYDFEVPFDNNLSERDLRHVKTKQKVSGFFKSMQGLQNYLDIKSIIGTCKKQGKDFYNVIADIFKGTPISI